MNKDNAKDYLPLVQALAEGKTLQAKSDITHFPKANEWFDLDDVGFVDPPEQYRVKPKPRRWWLVLGFDRGLIYSSLESARNCAPVTPHEIIEVVEVMK